MTSPFKTFFIKITIISLVIAAIGAVAFSTFLSDYYQHVFPIVVVFIAGVTLFTYFILNKANQDLNMRKFSTGFMLSITLRLFLYSIFVIVYLLLRRGSDDIIPFVLVFLSLYLIYTVFEIITILKDIQKMKQ